MQAQERRETISAILSQSVKPISANRLASRFNVSRQIIVGDIALLRASGIDIDATPRGYLLKVDDNFGFKGTIACRHNGEDMQNELYTIVDQGAKVLDVIVDHAIYGQLTGRLDLSSRYDVDQFIRKSKKEQAQPLSVITDGVHLHTINCPDEQTFQRIKDALRQKGFIYE